MTTIVTIKSTKPAVVISERITDRERFDNGSDLLEPNVPQDFIVHAGQSVRVIELPEPDAEPTTGVDQPATAKEA